MISTNPQTPTAPAVRPRHYPSDITDAEWAVLEALLPPKACTLPMGGRPEKHPRRNITDCHRAWIEADVH
ncbi:hypothetical protein ABZ921_09700 [Streptomyces atriruber]|uniref:Transposase n=1 Tax=Streptomyces atriruber TaxID=545121 RepID=A0ABV3BKP6_9ACTN